MSNLVDGVALHTAVTRTTVPPCSTTTAPSACRASRPVSIERLDGPNDVEARTLMVRLVEGSFAQLQGVEERSVGVFVVEFEVFEEASAAADHLQQSLAGVEIFLMGLEMRGELVDPFGEQRDLDLGGSGVLLMETELGNDGTENGCLAHRSSLSILSEKKTVNHRVPLFARRGLNSVLSPSLDQN